MIVYDKDGVDYDKEPVDVAECVNNLGWTRELPDESDAGEPSDSDKPDGKKKAKA
jgi:hypothetical protein